MSTVFFKTSEKLEQEVEKLMEAEGYTNKAEFFRFLVKFFKYHRPEEARLGKATEELASVLRALQQKDKLPQSLESQLSDV